MSIIIALFGNKIIGVAAHDSSTQQGFLSYTYNVSNMKLCPINKKMIAIIKICGNSIK